MGLESCAAISRDLARQAEIAREVMALDEIPGGVSREEYLRERLRELRIEVYASGERASE